MPLRHIPRILGAAVSDPRTSIAGGGLGISVLLFGVAMPLAEGSTDYRSIVLYAILGLGLTALGFYARDAPPAPPKDDDDDDPPNNRPPA